MVDANEKSTAKGYMEWEVVKLEYEGKFILKFAQGRRVFTTSVNGAKEPAKTKGDVRNCVYAARGIGDWTKTLAAYRKCDGLQFVLDEDYSGKDMVPYFKKNPAAYKKYLAIQGK